MTQTPRWRVAIGSDDAGAAYRDRIARDLKDDPRVEAVIDVGVYHGDADAAPYPEIGLAAAKKIAAGEVDRAVLVCGTGIGMAISANKVKGVRATTAHDPYSVERSVLSNNCQVLALGQRVVGPELARRLVHDWLGYVFDPSSPSQAKVALIEDHEEGRTGTGETASGGTP